MDHSCKGRLLEQMTASDPLVGLSSRYPEKTLLPVERNPFRSGRRMRGEDERNSRRGEQRIA